MGHEQHANSLSHTISIMNPMTSFWLTGSRRIEQQSAPWTSLDLIFALMMRT